MRRFQACSTKQNNGRNWLILLDIMPPIPGTAPEPENRRAQGVAWDDR